MTEDPKAEWAPSKALEIRLSFRGKTDTSQFFHTFPFVKGDSILSSLYQREARRDFMHYAILGRSYFLTHKYRIADSETEESDRHNGNDMGSDDDEALQEGKWILETGQRKSLHRPH